MMQIASQELVLWSAERECSAILINKMIGEILMATYWWGVWSEKVKVNIRHMWTTFSHVRWNTGDAYVSAISKDCLILHIS